MKICIGNEFYPERLCAAHPGAQFLINYRSQTISRPFVSLKPVSKIPCFTWNTDYDIVFPFSYQGQWPAKVCDIRKSKGSADIQTSCETLNVHSFHVKHFCRFKNATVFSPAEKPESDKSLKSRRDKTPLIVLTAASKTTPINPAVISSTF